MKRLLDAGYAVCGADFSTHPEKQSMISFDQM
jgi:hypothetical protein